MLFYSISICTQKLLLYLYNPTDLACVGCCCGQFWNQCGGSFQALGCVVVTSEATWSLFRQRPSFPFFTLSSFCLFLSRETAVSDIGLSGGKFHRCPPIAVLTPAQAHPGEKTMESLSLSQQLWVCNCSYLQKFLFCNYKLFQSELCNLCQQPGKTPASSWGQASLWQCPQPRPFPHPTAGAEPTEGRRQQLQQRRPHTGWQVSICLWNCSVLSCLPARGCHHLVTLFLGTHLRGTISERNSETPSSLCALATRLPLVGATLGTGFPGSLGLSLFPWGFELQQLGI